MRKKPVGKLHYIGILFTILMMVVTIIASFSPNFRPEDFSIFPFLGLMYPILLMINLLILIWWILRLRIWFLLPFLTLVLGYSSIETFYRPPFLNKSKESGNFKIATYNVAAFNSPISDADAKDLATFMKKEKVDVICMQEFSGNNILTDSLLYAVFSYWPYRYIPSENKSIIRPVIFSRYPLSNEKLIVFKDSKNCVIYCDVDVKNKFYRVFNAHLQTTDLTQIKEKGGGNLDYKRFYWGLKVQAMHRNYCKRAQQAEVIRSLIQKSPYPVLLCGDFNDSPISYTYKTILGDLKDGFVTNGKGYASTYRHASKIFRIDYIFYSDSLKATKCYTTEFGESDHYPVIMEMKI